MSRYYFLHILKIVSDMESPYTFPFLNNAASDRDIYRKRFLAKTTRNETEQR